MCRHILAWKTVAILRKIRWSFIKMLSYVPFRCLAMYRIILGFLQFSWKITCKIVHKIQHSLVSLNKYLFPKKGIDTRFSNDSINLRLVTMKAKKLLGGLLLWWQRFRWKRITGHFWDACGSFFGIILFGIYICVFQFSKAMQILIICIIVILPLVCLKSGNKLVCFI